MSQKVAIIGAGCSGLAAIKCCLEAGLQPVCFESSADIGGLWHFSQEIRDSRGCVMESTIINTSKEMMSFSDFPAPQEFPNFMHHTKVLEYFQLYAKRFDLIKYIQFKQEVISVQLYSLSDQSNDSEMRESFVEQCMRNQDRSWQKNGQDRDETKPKAWKLTVREAALTRDDFFDFVLVCTGHHAEPNVPYFPGQGIFQGKILHSRDLRKGSDVIGSRHVVVGVGNSGCDIAVELSRHGQVFLSSRRGTWIMHRLQRSGLPADVTYMSRLVFATALSLPQWLLNHVTAWLLNQKIDHALYGLNPQHGPFATHPTVNDELPTKIASGQVIVKPNIDSFTLTGVKFEDDSIEEDISTVLLATGYKISFPFLDSSVLQVNGNHVQLYKYMFPPHLTSLAVIGCVQTGGALAPVAEMQCRLAVQVFKGDIELPSQPEMLADIERKKQAMRYRYVQTQRHTIQVDYIPYMDELANMIGCKPQWGTLCVHDPRLVMACLFGPCTSYQYRLFGPNTWPGAKQAICHQMERIKWPFTHRPTIEHGADFYIFFILCSCFIFLHFILSMWQ